MLTAIRHSVRTCGRSLPTGLLLLLTAITLTSPAAAQERYFPLNQATPPGVYGEWSGWQHRTAPQRLQAVRVELPEAGQVTFFSRVGEQPLVRKSPAQAAVALGGSYRLKIENIPNYPGIELYPTIELVDVLHPPLGREDEYPIPVVITEEDIDLALAGHLVTKVVYIESAREANPLTAGKLNPTLDVDPQSNVIQEADLRGRPMLILRIGGRLPAANEEPAFYGAGAPLAASVNAR